MCVLKFYVNDYYLNGNCNVLRKIVKSKEFLIVCIEDYSYDNGECWNGFWKFKWIF